MKSMRAGISAAWGNVSDGKKKLGEDCALEFWNKANRVL